MRNVLLVALGFVIGWGIDATVSRERITELQTAEVDARTQLRTATISIAELKLANANAETKCRDRISEVIRAMNKLDAKTLIVNTDAGQNVFPVPDPGTKFTAADWIKLLELLRAFSY